MKKLMIALSAAAMFSLCAQAADLAGAEDFEGKTAGDPISASGFWLTGGGDSVVAEYDEEEAPEGNTKYLKVDTTEVLQRGTGVIPEEGDAKAGAVELDGGTITISSKVQFTAADEAPTAGDGDKLLVWAKAPEDGAEDQKIYLCVTSMNPEDGESMVTVTKTSVDAGKWYTLNVIAGESEDGAMAPITFTVELDDGEGKATVGTGFMSLVDSETTGAGTISSVGFKGTGAVDDIAFSYEAGYVPADITVTVATAGVEGLEVYTDEEGTAYTTPLAMKARQTVTLFVVDDGYKAVTASKGSAELNDGMWKIEYLLTDEDAGEEGALTITITVTPGGEPEPTPVEPTVTKPETASWVEGKAPEASYEVGSTIDPTAFEATTTKAHKKAVVTVTVNGEAITEEYTVQADDVITITVTEEDITFTLTIPTVTGATADQVTQDVVEGTEVTINWTAVEGYKITDGATQTITITADVTANEPTVVELATVTVTVDEETVGATVKVASSATEGDTLTFTVTVADDYKADTLVVTVNGETVTPVEGEYSVEVGTENIVIKAVAEKQQSGGDLPTYLEGASEDAIAAYATWAETYGADTASANEEAFLLNCAPNKDAVDAAKTAFKIVSIEVDAEGNVTVGEPDGSYNGEIVIEGSEKIGAEAAWHVKKAGDKFFRATLVMPMAPVAK